MDMSSDCVLKMQKIASCVWALTCVQELRSETRCQNVEVEAAGISASKADVARFHGRNSSCVFHCFPSSTYAYQLGFFWLTCLVQEGVD